MREGIKLNTVWHRLDQTQSSLLLIQTSISHHVTGSGSKQKHVQGSGSADTSECGSAAGAEGRSLNGACRTAKSGPRLGISAPPSNLFACSQAGRHRYTCVCEHEIGPRIKPRPPPPPSWILRLFSSVNCTCATVNIVQILHYHL